MSDLIPTESIVGRILYLRGEKVLLDRDLATLYGVETRVLNQAVSRNMDRFPPDFMFVLTREEIMRISQNVISSKIKYAKRVRAFTEHGAIMAASVLNSSRAINTAIFVVRAFVRLRKELAGLKGLGAKLAELEKRLENHDETFLIVFDAIQALLETDEKPEKKIGFTAKEKQKGYGQR